MQTLQDPILQLSWVCTRLSNPKSGVDLSFINDLFNKIASNNQHAHNGLLQSVKVPLPLLPAGCFAAAGIYGSLQTSCPTFFFRFHLSERASERASERFEVALTSSVSSVTLGSVVACT